MEPSYIANDDITKSCGGGGGGGGGWAHNLGYASLGVRTTYPLTPRQWEKKPNAGRRPPRMVDARAEIEGP